jgi:phosphatidylserine decarboxylase
LDICTVTYNNLNYLRIFIESLFKNTKDFNLYVSDSGSTDGTVEYLKYHQGKYLAAFDEHAMNKNERMEIGINSNYGKVLFTQVAGFLARRIVTELKIGDAVKIGNRFGMIKFGSRIDIYVPSDFKPSVKLNDRVTAGETILFELNK